MRARRSCKTCSKSAVMDWAFAEAHDVCWPGLGSSGCRAAIGGAVRHEFQEAHTYCEELAFWMQLNQSMCADSLLSIGRVCLLEQSEDRWGQEGNAAGKKRPRPRSSQRRVMRALLSEPPHCRSGVNSRGCRKHLRCALQNEMLCSFIALPFQLSTCAAGCVFDCCAWCF